LKIIFVLIIMPNVIVYSVRAAFDIGCRDREN